MPLSQDHKRVGEGETGPNTGGMGVVGPLSISPELDQEIHEKILAPTVKALEKNHLFYRGVIYIGLMITSQGPKVIEYNVRFGDPEAQVIFPLLDGDWGEVFDLVSRGAIPQLKWKKLFTSCVVMAAEGYPDNPVKGISIDGDIYAQTPSSYFLSAGVQKATNSDNSAIADWQTGGAGAQCRRHRFQFKRVSNQCLFAK